MDSANDTIRHFRAIFLPPADNILTGDLRRTYIKISRPPGEALHLINTLASKVPSDVDLALKAFIETSDAINVASQPAANQWLDNVFDALRAFLPDIQTIEGQYADDTLYIVTMPEFGLNGWQASDYIDDDDDGKMWDARGAFPSSLETYIRDGVCRKLRSNPFNRFHILFVFSCFTHSTMEPLVKLDIDGSPKIVANNRLSVVCIGSPAPEATAYVHTVTKFAWNPAADMVRSELFTPETAWNSTTQANIFGMPGIKRNDHTQFTLPWPHKDGSDVVLGFGTCQDVLVDNHPPDRIVILCGSGTPFLRVPEVANLPMSYPFLLNDMQSWSVYPSVNGRPRRDQLQSAGYYQFLSVPPTGTQSIAQKFANIPEPSGIPRSKSDRQEMSNYYLYPTPQESNAVSFGTAIAHQNRIVVSTTAAHIPLFKYTDNIPLRRAPETNETKGNCIIS